MTPAPKATATSNPRPIVITTICVIGFLMAFAFISLAISNVSRRYGAWYPPYLVLGGFISFVSMLGLWKMKRWAVFSFAGYVLFHQIVMFEMGMWSFPVILIPGIATIIAIMHLPKMR